MRTFTCWREVGRVMRWARKEGFVRDRTVMRGSWHYDRPSSVHVDHRWRGFDGQDVQVSHSSYLTSVDVSASDGHNDWDSTYNDDAAQVLRVLVALGLIPAELAEVAS